MKQTQPIKKNYFVSSAVTSPASPMTGSLAALQAGLLALLLISTLMAACGGSSPGSNSSARDNVAGNSANSDNMNGDTDSDEDNNSMPEVRGSCAPGATTIMLGASLADDEAKQYFLIPFSVDSNTRRIEIGYGWNDNSSTPNPNPLDSSTFDLGLWDQNGYRNADGFRGWSGDRQGRLDQGKMPVWVEKGSAERGYIPGEIIPGEWYLEIGVGAVKTGGATWYAEINCLSSDSGAIFTKDPLDKNFAAVQNSPPYPGWYHADFHMHGFHSNSQGIEASGMLENARTVGLDVLFYTEYVVPQHWDELGTLQQQNSDLLIYPGREIITYFGHINTLGETRSVLDYRHGFEDIALGDIQQAAVTAGALIQINHPTTFEGPLFEDLCRGCAFTLNDDIDFSMVDSIEVQGGPTTTTSANVGISGPPGSIENPFTGTAIDYWEARLNEGFKITATSGADARGHEDLVPGVSGHGSSSTALCYTNENNIESDGVITRARVQQAIKNGCAIVKTFGTYHSPHVEMTTSNAAGDEVTYGGQLTVPATSTATMQLTITGAANQSLLMIQNGNEIATALTCNGIPLTSPAALASDNVTCSATLTRAASGDGPLGTFWRFDIKKREPENTVAPVEIRTLIANPIFLVDE